MLFYAPVKFCVGLSAGAGMMNKITHRKRNNREKEKENMRGILKATVGLFAAVLFLAGFRAEVQASTGVYVGKDVSAEGTTAIGVSAEYMIGTMTMPEIIEKGTYKKGDVIEASNGFTYTLPEDSAKMLITREMTYVGDNGWNCAASNEYGVNVVANISIATNDDAQLADPFVENGLTEERLATVAVSTAKTANEAVKILCSVMDETGSCEAETILIADPEETWVLENFTGHQYAARKLPTDVIAVFSNDPIITSVDPKDPDTIVSEGLLTLPEENGFAVYDDDKNIDLVRTYNWDHNFVDEAHLRAWYGQIVFAPSKDQAYSPDADYDIFFAPDDKVSLTQVFDFFRSRYEGTDFDLNLKDNADLYWGINSQRVSNVDVIQIFDDVPAAMSAVLWETPGNPTVTPFVPIPTAVSELPDMITTDVTDDAYVDGVMQFDFVRLNNGIIARRELYGASVKDFWEGREFVSVNEVESLVRDNWKNVYDGSEEAGSGCFNDYADDIISSADEDCKRINNEFEYYLFRNGVWKQQIPDEDLQPFECSFDAVAFANANGWDATVEDGLFTATKDGKTIEVILDGDDEGSVTIKGYDSLELMEGIITGNEVIPADADDVEVEVIEIEETTDDNSTDDADDKAATEDAADTETWVDINGNEAPVETDAAADDADTDAAAKDEDKDAAAKDADKDAAAKDEDKDDTAKDADKASAEDETEDLTKAAAEQIQVDTIAELEQYFAEKIADIPRDGWAENEIASELTEVSNGVADIIVRHFTEDYTEDIEELMSADYYNKLGSDIINDPEVTDLGDRLAKAGTELSGLMTNYFDSLYEDVSDDIVNGRLTQEGAEKILLEAETDIEGIAQIYMEAIQTSFDEIFDATLGDEEFNELLDEISDAVNVLDEYDVIDLESVGVDKLDLRKDLNDLSQADIDVVITLDGMDDEVIDGLSDMFGVDVRTILDEYVEAINEAGLN